MSEQHPSEERIEDGSSPYFFEALPSSESGSTPHITHRRGLVALSPLPVFLLIYLGTALLARDFTKAPITVAFLLSGIYSVTITKGVSLSRRIRAFSKGAGTKNMMLMLWIFVLAGAFASSAKAMGSIDATVDLTLRVLPPGMVLPGLFIAACFISLSIGTSVGTIVALVPVAAQLGDASGISVPLITAVVAGGSFFGDNLSFISDTTIAATGTQNVEMKDKFRVNSFIVIPAAVIVLAIYVWMGKDYAFEYQSQSSIDFIKVLPYIAVLVTAILGVNVLGVLTLGLFLSGLIGVAQGSYDLLGWFDAMSTGILGMSELIIVTMLAGGLLEIIRANGGIDYIIRILSKYIRGKRGAELSIAGLVSLVNVCTANNTVAILTVGGVTKQISERYGVDGRKAASLLDTFSCCIQGLLPYGAQMLIASGLAGVSPVVIIPNLYYSFALGIAGLLAVLFRYPRRFS